VPLGPRWRGEINYKKPQLGERNRVIKTTTRLNAMSIKVMKFEISLPFSFRDVTTFQGNFMQSSDIVLCGVGTGVFCAKSCNVNIASSTLEFSVLKAVT
jgi:hypothetical protein